jgi:hypothetical protein
VGRLTPESLQNLVLFSAVINAPTYEGNLQILFDQKFEINVY